MADLAERERDQADGAPSYRCLRGRRGEWGAANRGGTKEQLAATADLEEPEGLEPELSTEAPSAGWLELPGRICWASPVMQAAQLRPARDEHGDGEPKSRKTEKGKGLHALMI